MSSNSYESRQLESFPWQPFWNGKQHNDSLCVAGKRFNLGRSLHSGSTLSAGAVICPGLRPLSGLCVGSQMPL